MGYALNDIEAIKEHLRSLPAADLSDRTISKQEAIRQLLRELTKARRSKGYSFEKLAQELTAKGVAINAGTLKSYLNRATGKRRSSPKRARSGGTLGAGQAATEQPRPANVGTPSRAAAEQRPPKKPPSEEKEAEAKKGGFTPREDSNDI